MARKPVPKVVMPWDAVDLTASEAASVKAVRDGVATPSQQQMCWHVMVHKVCNVGALSFTFGPDGERAGDFAEGKRWSGRTLELIADRKFPVDTRGAPPPMPKGEGEQPAD